MEIKALTKEQAKNLAEQDGKLFFERTLRKIMGKDTLLSYKQEGTWVQRWKNPLDVFDYLPFLYELATKQTILGFKSSFDNDEELTVMVNLHYGTLCYKAHHKELEGLKTKEEYAIEWGQCLEALVNRVDKGDVKVLTEAASSIHKEFTPFKDKAKAEEFANIHYQIVFENLHYGTYHHNNPVDGLVDLASKHLSGENYSNKKLLKKAGEKALTIAGEYPEFRRFRLYAYICFDIDGRCPFRATEIYRKAALKAVEYKEEAPSKFYLDQFKDSLKEIEDQQTLDLLI